MAAARAAAEGIAALQRGEVTVSALQHLHAERSATAMRLVFSILFFPARGLAGSTSKFRYLQRTKPKLLSSAFVFVSAFRIVRG